MREVQQYAEMPAFDEDVLIYEACDKQSGVIDTVTAPCGVKIMGYNGQWAAVWRENGFIPMTRTIRRTMDFVLAGPAAGGRISRDEAVRKSCANGCPKAKSGTFPRFTRMRGCWTRTCAGMAIV